MSPLRLGCHGRSPACARGAAAAAAAAQRPLNVPPGRLHSPAPPARTAGATLRRAPALPRSVTPLGRSLAAAAPSPYAARRSLATKGASPSSSSSPSSLRRCCSHNHNGDGNHAHTTPSSNDAAKTATPEDAEDDEDDGEALECPWGWCHGDRVAHRVLCLTSKAYFGVSWMHSHTRQQIWLQGEADPWARDPLSTSSWITGLEETPVPPPERIVKYGVRGLLPEELCFVDAEDFASTEDDEYDLPPPLPGKKEE